MAPIEGRLERPSDLPELPDHEVVVVEDRPSLDPPGFLRLRRAMLRMRFADGSESPPFEYDAVERFRLDAVVVAAHYRDAGRKRRVILRSSIRPPAALRAKDAIPTSAQASRGGFWELPAGLVEADERSPEGLRRSAARELLEEAGVEVDPASLTALGPSGFPAPAIIGERHFFFHVEIDPSRARTPTEDGSALERHAALAHVELGRAIALAREGWIEDEKTELALRRLAEVVG